MMQELSTGIRLSVSEFGDPEAEPLLMVTGAGGSKDGWGPLIRALATRYRLICFDCRGLGESDAGDGPLSMDALADDMAALLDALGIARTHVLAWSFGSGVAQAFALRHAERLGALVLWSTWGRTDGYMQAMFTALRYPFARRDPETAVSVLRLVFSPELLGSPASGELLEELVPLFPRTEEQLRTTVEQWDAALAHDTLDRLPSITGPTLVVAGEKDVLCPPRMGQAVAARLPDARYEVFCGPGSSHALGLERPDEFSTLVFGFLADHPLAALAGAR
ncbi:alpha/beta fold hydrolase [Streptomyces sp. NPDC001922]|uniref:alpha/beta fold hydrolase n=1 Tax=Streptomyces sp. NPDC001922 TaxID=3364624 RepID=UPI0036CF5C8E